MGNQNIVLAEVKSYIDENNVASYADLSRKCLVEHAIWMPTIRMHQDELMAYIDDKANLR